MLSLNYNSSQLLSDEEWSCLFSNNVSSSSEELELFKSRENESESFCHRSWDGILCWPFTPAGHDAILPCFSILNRVRYNTSGTATRTCDVDGFWQNKTDYTGCIPLGPVHTDDNSSLNITTGFYLGGYFLSLIFLFVALIIFLTFKELRCIRNKIHTQLILTYILSDALWIITNFTSYQGNFSTSSHISCITFILLHYVHMTNFFWMFVEGLYLYVLVVQTFMAENFKLRIYCLIGWGIPLMVVIGWSFVKWITQQEHNGEESILMNDIEFSITSSTCLWLNVNDYDWIYKTPVIFVLGANLIFLFQIMWVLIIKLRSAMSPETQQSRKAAKALLVLMPLLGITYVLILTGSKDNPIYEYMRALLISTQGFLVALLYCFLNGEVRVAIRHRWNRWYSPPNLNCFRHETQHLQMRDWSPRSQTESIRLYPTGGQYRKRESSASNATSMTIVPGSYNGSNLFSYVNKSRRFSPAVTVTICNSKEMYTNEPNTFV